MNISERIRRFVLGKSVLMDNIGNMTGYSANWSSYDDKGKTIVLLNVGFCIQPGDWIPQKITVVETFYDAEIEQDQQ